MFYGISFTLQPQAVECHFTFLLTNGRLIWLSPVQGGPTADRFLIRGVARSYIVQLWLKLCLNVALVCRTTKATKMSAGKMWAQKLHFSAVDRLAKVTLVKVLCL